MTATRREGSGISAQFSEEATFVVSSIPGVGDFTTIQAALNALPAAGGLIIVRDGTLIQTTPNTLPDKNVVIRGCGVGVTIINLGGFSEAAFLAPNGLTADRTYVFEDFSVVGTSVAGSSVFQSQDANSHAIFIARRVNSSGIHNPVVYTATGANPIYLYMDDCHFIPYTDGSSILVSTTPGIGATIFAYMQRVLFMNLFFDNVVGALTGGGFFVDFTGVNLIGEDCIFSIGTGSTVGALAHKGSLFLNGGAGNPVIAVADDNEGVVSSGLINCGGAFVSFNFSGNGTKVVGGLYNSVGFTDTAISSFDDVQMIGTVPSITGVIVGSGDTYVADCDISAVATAGNFVLDGNFAAIIGCTFRAAGAGLTAIIRTTNGTANIIGNRMPSNVVTSILESGGTSSNDISDNTWVTDPILIANSNAKVNGAKRFNVDGLATTDNLVILFTHRNGKGLAGSGSLKNTGGNNLAYQIDVTDSYGVAGSHLFNPIAPGGTAFWDVSQLNGDGTELPPYVVFTVSVKSSAAGTPTTVSVRHMSVGAY